MERVYSVEDIVGTLWNSDGDLSVGVQSNAGGNGGEDELTLTLIRSPSVFYLQEFIQQPRKEPPISSSDEEGEEDDDLSQVPVRDDVVKKKVPSPVEDGSKPRQEQHDADSQKREGALPGRTPAQRADLHPDSSPHDADPQRREAAPTDSTRAPRVHFHPDLSLPKPQEMATSLLPGPVSPLFAGLHSKMMGLDPQEMNEHFKRELKEACLRACQKGPLCLPESRRNYSVGKEVGNIPTSSGGIMPENILNKPVTSGSSPDQSDEEEVDNELLKEPGDKKRVKRMLSNRESARRSRSRKQAHLNELEAQVGQLRVENSTLIETLHTTAQKLKDATKDNLHLKTTVELLKAKWQNAMTVHRQLSMTGPNARSALAAQEMAAVSRPFHWDAHVPSLQPPSSSPYVLHPPMTASGLPQFDSHMRDVGQQSISRTVQQGMKMSRTPSMQRVGSTDHLQKKIRNANSSFCPTPWGSSNLVDLEGPSMVPQYMLSGDH